jgi:5-methylcytosine-specific restriction endonuclease McrBC GTP-binding regulatory subunit McrB
MQNQDWYDMWMAQSKAFYSSAESNLKDMFGKQSGTNPEDHLQQIQAWLKTLSSQWNVMNLNEQQKPFEQYWKTMAELSSQASELMLKEWIKRTKEDKPISNVHELYELWLNCCHEVYAKAIRSPDYQALYGDFMNEAMKFWKSAMPK